MTGELDRHEMTGRRRRRWPIIAVAATLVAGGVATTSVGSASAAVPQFPDNIVVFPDRDFVSFEGYSDYVGQTVTIEVSRPGVGIVGSTTGVMGAGDPPLEVNHPGGVCWGNGTGLNVTPDIVPGDKVTLKLGGSTLGDATAQDAYVSPIGALAAFELAGNVLTVRGHIGQSVNRDQMEQRIVNPDLRDLVGRRDVRATDPVLTPAPTGGYSSMLEFPAGGTNDTFVATYVFDDPAAAEVAAAGEQRVLTWQVVDAEANRQGLTIAEFGLVGGPGMGGCPNGPTQAGPPAPTSITAVRSNDQRSITLSWTPAAAIPGTAAIDGYSVVAVGEAGAVDQTLVGKRINNGGASGTVISGLNPATDYTLEVRSSSTAGETFPAATPHVTMPGEDVTPPVATVSPAGGSFATPPTVTLGSNEPGSQIFFSLTGADVIVDGDTLSNDPSITAFTAPFVVPSSTTLTFAVFDPSGNITTGSQQFVITNDPVPAAPVFTSATPAFLAVNLAWTAPDAGAPGLTIGSYELQVYTSAGAIVGAPVTIPGTATTFTAAGLTGDVSYQFGLRALNVNGPGPESARISATALGNVVANAGPDQTGIARGSVVNLSGAGSTIAGATYAWSQTSGNPVTISGASSLNASFTFPLFSHPTTTNPAATFQLAVTVGATTKTDTVTVTSQADVVTISQARFKVGELRLVGTGTVPTAILRFHTGGTNVATGLNGPVLANALVVWTAPTAPGLPWDWTVRIKPFNGADPGRITVESNRGGTATVATTR
jgi:Fibronectin type III domain